VSGAMSAQSTAEGWRGIHALKFRFLPDGPGGNRRASAGGVYRKEVR
jgi:hypothetical protein